MRLPFWLYDLWDSLRRGPATAPARPYRDAFSLQLHVRHLEERRVLNAEPVLLVNELAINEDDTVLITREHLNASHDGADAADLVFTISGPTNGQFEFVDDKGNPITEFTLQDIDEAKVQFVHTGGEFAPTYQVTVTYEEWTTEPEAADIDFNRIPQLQTNELAIKIGETLVVTPDHLKATDPDPADDDADLTFIITLENDYGWFALESDNERTPISQFTQAQVQSGEIVFVHDGTDNTPAYKVAVSDGKATTAADSAAVNTFPQLVANTLTINQDATVPITSAHLSATDLEDDDQTLTFNIVNPTNGHFELQETPNGPWNEVNSFTQADITAGRVRFVHTGGTTAPAYSVTVTDSGPLTSDPAPAAITFNAAPEIVINELTIHQGGTVVLTSANLQATDDGPVSELIFTVVGTPERGHFQVSQNGNWVQATTFTQQQLDEGHVRFVHDGTKHVPSYTLRVTDGGGLTHTRAADITFIAGPVLLVNQLTLNQGDTILITLNHIRAEGGNNDSQLRFTVSNIQQGEFQRLQGSNWTTTTQFSQQDIVQGHVRFVHNGTANAPSYTVTVVIVNGVVSDSSEAIIAFNRLPQLLKNELTINEGATLVVTPDHLKATDPDLADADADLTFIISERMHGWFALASVPATAISQFTQAEVEAGEIVFVHDGSNNAPSYKVSVWDGKAATTPVAAETAVVNVPPAFTSLEQTIIGTGPILEGTTVVVVTGTFFDPGLEDVHTVTINWDDGTASVGAQAGGAFFVTQAGEPGHWEFSATHVYATDGSYQIAVTVTDGESDPVAAAPLPVSVQNVVPELLAVSFLVQPAMPPALPDPLVGSTEINEGESVTVIGTFSDPGLLDQHTVIIDWGDGSLSTVVLAVGARTFVVTHVYEDNHPEFEKSTISIAVTDDPADPPASNRLSNVMELQVQVHNVAPEATIVVGGVQHFEGFWVELTADVVDPGIHDTFIYEWHVYRVLDDSDPDAMVLDLLPEWSRVGGQFQEFAFVPEDEGRYWVTLLVTDDRDPNSWDTAATTIDVLNAPPEITSVQWIVSDAEGRPVQRWLGEYSGGQVQWSVFEFEDGVEGEAVPAEGPPQATEGQRLELIVQFRDWGINDAHTVSIDWGETAHDLGSTAFQLIAGASQPEQIETGGMGEPAVWEVRATVRYLDNLPGNEGYPVTIHVQDDADVPGEDSVVTPLAVLDAPPVVTVFVMPAVVHEGNVVQVIVRFEDQGILDTHQFDIDWGDVSHPAPDVLQLITVAPQPLLRDSGGDGWPAVWEFTATARFLDNLPGNAPYQVTVTVTDLAETATSGAGSIGVPVQNVPPGFISLTNSGVSPEGVVTVTGEFADRGVLDFHTVRIDWGDGSFSDVPVVPFGGGTVGGGGGTFSASHTYLGNPDLNNPAADIPISVTVTDNDGASTTQVTVAQTPAGGLVAPVVPAMKVVEPPMFTPAPVVDFPQMRTAPPQAADATVVESGGIASLAAPEARLVLRVVSQTGEEVHEEELDDDALDDLPGLYRKLPDNRYRLYLVREDGTARQVNDVVVRQGRPIDPHDDLERTAVRRIAASSDDDPAADGPLEGNGEAADADDGDHGLPLLPVPADNDIRFPAPALDRGAGPPDDLPESEGDEAAAVERDWRMLAAAAKLTGAAALLAAAAGPSWQKRVERAMETYRGRRRLSKRPRRTDFQSVRQVTDAPQP